MIVFVCCDTSNRFFVLYNFEPRLFRHFIIYTFFVGRSWIWDFSILWEIFYCDSIPIHTNVLILERDFCVFLLFYWRKMVFLPSLVSCFSFVIYSSKQFYTIWLCFPFSQHTFALYNDCHLIHLISIPIISLVNQFIKVCL